MLMVTNNNRGLLDLRASLMQLSERADKAGPLCAEIVSGSEPRWYIVVTTPGQEGIAAGHLIGRRFGVYQPRFPDPKIIRGRKQRRWRNLFPCYLFVFVWDAERHARRILACPGVARMLCIGERPVPVPFDVIDHLRAEENKLNPVQYTIDVVRVRKRRKKRTQVTEQKVVEADPDDIISVSSKSYWTLDEPERFSLLHKALGLPE